MLLKLIGIILRSPLFTQVVMFIFTNLCYLINKMSEKQTPKSSDEFSPEIERDIQEALDISKDRKKPAPQYEGSIDDDISVAAKASRKLLGSGTKKAIAGVAATAAAIGGPIAAVHVDEATKVETSQTQGFIDKGDGTQAAFDRVLDEAEAAGNIDRGGLFVSQAEDDAHAVLHSEMVDDNGHVHPGQSFTVTTYKGGLLGLPFIEAHENKPEQTSDQDEPQDEDDSTELPAVKTR